MAVRKIDGHWYADIRFGRLRFRKKSPEDSRRGAEAFEHLLKQKLLSKGSLEDPKTEKERTFEEFSKEWFKLYVLVNCKYSDQLTKESLIRVHLVPFFGKMKLKEITSKSVEQFKRQQSTTDLDPKTINNHLGVLSKILRTAVEWGDLDTIPFIKRLKTQVKEVPFLTDEECSKLLTDMVEPQWTFMFFVGLNTGMRLGELRGLRWEAIDFNQHTITVKQSIVRGRITSPKNHKTRVIPMTPILDNTLFAMRQTSGWVFNQTDDDLNVAKRAADGLARMCKRNGIERIGWHRLRHTFASRLVILGVAIYPVQKLLGHSSIKMTERYAHLSPNVLQEAVAVLSIENPNFGQYVGSEKLLAPISA